MHVSYKNHKSIDKPKEEWIRVENTHEAIIDMDTWELARQVDQMHSHPQYNKLKQISLFGGMTTQHITIYYNCIGAFAVPDRRNIPAVQITMGTRKGVAVSYSPERIA